MGDARWNPSSWTSYATAHVDGKRKEEVFSATRLKSDFDPAGIEVRESRDSASNPNSTAVILGCDVTGSMGMIAERLIRGGLDKVMRETYERKPVPDPHIMAMAIGDATCDEAPLQATQFEADIRIATQVQNLWIEHGGGGNSGESYSLAHLFAAMKTGIDCHERHGRKGYLFTIGDEPNLDGVTAAQASRFLGIPTERDLTAAEILSMASRTYEVFHIVIKQGNYARSRLPSVLSSWNPLLGQRVLLLDDYEALPELIVSAMQVAEGARIDEVASSWGTKTALVIAGAFQGVPAVVGGGRGVRRLG